MKILDTKQFIDEKMKIMPISNNELDNINLSPITLLKNPKKSDLKEGDVCITEENDNTRNLYIVAKGSTANHIIAGYNNELLLVQSDDYVCQFIDLNDYNEKLKDNEDDEYDIKYVFRTNLKPFDFDAEHKLKDTIHSIYHKICEYYPNEAQYIKF